jgi:hypothetical protein
LPSADIFIADISHNLSPAFSVYFSKDGVWSLIITNNKITDPNDSYLLTPLTSICNFASTSVINNSVNPYVTWNFNKTWNSTSLQFSTNESISATRDYYKALPNNLPGDISITNIRNITPEKLAQDAKNAVNAGELVPATQVATFNGNKISTRPLQYSGIATGSKPIVSTTGSNETSSQPSIYINLITIFLTFPSSIC